MACNNLQLSSQLWKFEDLNVSRYAILSAIGLLPAVEISPVSH